MIILRRTGALGDVIAATPIVAELVRQHGPIMVETAYPAVFHNFIGVTTQPAGAPVRKHFDLDGAYERLPDKHMVHAYAAACYMALEPEQCSTWLWQAAHYPDVDLSRAVVVHAGRSWQNRTLPRATWFRVLTKLVEHGLHPVLVGTGRDWVFSPIDGVTDLTGILTIHEVAAIIERSRCFIGADSAMLHVAGSTTQTPIVGVFTSVLPERRMPWRHGELGWRCAAVQPALPCIGCIERLPPPVTFCGCERGDFACVTDVTSDQIVEAAVKLIGDV